MKIRYILIFLCFFIISCSAAPTLTETAFQKATLCSPAYDVSYDILWQAAITAVQEIGYPPIESYPENNFIKTDFKIESEDVVAGTKKSSTIYIFFEKKDKPVRPEYVLKICAPVHESPLNKNSWVYLESDINIQQKIKERFESVLDRMYRKGIKR
jgi:hypothetical protein